MSGRLGKFPWRTLLLLVVYFASLVILCLHFCMMWLCSCYVRSACTAWLACLVSARVFLWWLGQKNPILWRASVCRCVWAGINTKYQPLQAGMPHSGALAPAGCDALVRSVWHVASHLVSFLSECEPIAVGYGAAVFISSPPTHGISRQLVLGAVLRSVLRRSCC